MQYYNIVLFDASVLIGLCYFVVLLCVLLKVVFVACWVKNKNTSACVSRGVFTRVVGR